MNRKLFLTSTLVLMLIALTVVAYTSARTSSPDTSGVIIASELNDTQFGETNFTSSLYSVPVTDAIGHGTLIKNNLSATATTGCSRGYKKVCKNVKVCGKYKYGKCKYYYYKQVCSCERNGGGDDDDDDGGDDDDDDGGDDDDDGGGDDDDDE